MMVIDFHKKSIRVFLKKCFSILNMFNVYNVFNVYNIMFNKSYVGFPQLLTHLCGNSKVHQLMWQPVLKNLQ